MITPLRRQKMLLLFGDVALILLATQLAPFIRYGRMSDIFDIHTGASVFTMILYVVAFYISDLYNTGRNFRSADTALRSAIAVGAAGFFSVFLFYSIWSWVS